MRLRGISLLLLCVAAAPAQVRYHFGNDPHWAARDFVDSKWPVSVDGSVPKSDTPDEMLWVRERIAVPDTWSEPGVVMWPADCGDALPGARGAVCERRIGAEGKMPPDVELPVIAAPCVFAVPANIAGRGHILSYERVDDLIVKPIEIRDTCALIAPDSPSSWTRMPFISIR